MSSKKSDAGKGDKNRIVKFHDYNNNFDLINWKSKKKTICVNSQKTKQIIDIDENQIVYKDTVIQMRKIDKADSDIVISLIQNEINKIKYVCKKFDIDYKGLIDES